MTTGYRDIGTKLSPLSFLFYCNYTDGIRNKKIAVIRIIDWNSEFSQTTNEDNVENKMDV